MGAKQVVTINFSLASLPAAVVSGARANICPACAWQAWVSWGVSRKGSLDHPRGCRQARQVRLVQLSLPPCALLVGNAVSGFG